MEDPWLITSREDLIALAEFLNSGDAAKNYNNCYGYYFKQTADIDLTDVTWEPIGYSSGTCFSGNYDGDGHIIANAYSEGKADIDKKGNYSSTAGIFGWVLFGSVQNLHVKAATFEATGKNDYSFVGGITGVCFGASIQNCSVTDSKLESKRNNNNNCAGSIAGYSTGGRFEKCAAEGNKIKSMAYGGGFVGEVDDTYGAGTSTFTNCYAADCTVTATATESQGTNFMGGFAGEITDSTLSVNNCYVYKVTLVIDEKSLSTKSTGVFAGGLLIGSTISATNCFYGECFYGERKMTETAKGVASKTAEEFENGTVAGWLGDAFAQARNYPEFKADYSAVDAAIAKADKLNSDEYNNFSAVEAAINAVVRGKPLSEQDDVDAMAKAIEDAIAALQYKGADYSKVDAAIAKANALNKDDYKDFSAVEAAINAVDRRKTFKEQDEVDAMAKAIEDAIAALQFKGADYSKVDEAIAKADKLNRDEYKDFSAVETAVNAVVRDKNITEQTAVDTMAKDIEDAIAALQYKDADYTKVDAALAKANALKKDDYKDFSAVESAVNAVARGKNITEQGEVDAMAKAIEDAIAALQPKDKGADYSAVDAAIAKANALNKDEYKDFSAVEAAVSAVVRGKPLSEQTEVDAMAQAIENAIAALQYKGADYSKVDAAIAKANALNKDDYKDFSAVEAAINAVDRRKTFKEQDEVDAMAKAIEDAIAALQFKGADYSKVDEAIAKADKLNRDEYKDFSAVEAAVRAVVRGKPLSEQTAVDAMAKAIEDAIAALEKKPVAMTVQLPQTGDDSNLALWMALLLVSGAAICTMMAGKKKNYGK